MFGRQDGNGINEQSGHFITSKSVYTLQRERNVRAMSIIGAVPRAQPCHRPRYYTLASAVASFLGPEWQERLKWGPTSPSSRSCSLFAPIWCQNVSSYPQEGRRTHISSLVSC